MLIALLFSLFFLAHSLLEAFLLLQFLNALIPCLKGQAGVVGPMQNGLFDVEHNVGGQVEGPSIVRPRRWEQQLAAVRGGNRGARCSNCLGILCLAVTGGAKIPDIEHLAGCGVHCNGEHQQHPGLA